MKISACIKKGFIDLLNASASN